MFDVMLQRFSAAQIKSTAVILKMQQTSQKALLYFLMIEVFSKNAKQPYINSGGLFRSIYVYKVVVVMWESECGFSAWLC